MNLTELEEYYLEKHLDGMDRSAIRKELQTKNLSEEDQKTVLTYIDDSIMKGARKSSKELNINTRSIYIGGMIIAIVAVGILSFAQSDGRVIALPGLIPLFIIVRAVSKKNMRKAERRSSRFKR